MSEEFSADLREFVEDIHGALDFIYQILQPDRALGDNDFQNLCGTFNHLSTSVGKLLQHTEPLEEWDSMLNSRDALSPAEFHVIHWSSFTDLRLIKYLTKKKKKKLVALPNSIDKLLSLALTLQLRNEVLLDKTLEICYLSWSQQIMLL